MKRIGKADIIIHNTRSEVWFRKSSLKRLVEVTIKIDDLHDWIRLWSNFIDYIYKIQIHKITGPPSPYALVQPPPLILGFSPQPLHSGSAPSSYTWVQPSALTLGFSPQPWVNKFSGSDEESVKNFRIHQWHRNLESVA